MHLAIIGYGRMGKEIADVAIGRGHTFTTVDVNAPDAEHAHIAQESVGPCDVCIDFTHPQSVVGNIEQMASLGKHMVIGTTGWYGELDHVRSVVEEHDVGLLWSPNFSIGVNLFFRLVTAAAAIFDNVADYDVMGYEIHHNGKADSPSGTAIKMAQQIVDTMSSKDTPVYEMLNRRPEPNELHFASLRGGSNPGRHTVLFDSPFDTIELTHQNRTRRGLAVGAVLAAEYMSERKGFHSIDDLIDSMVGE